MPMDFFLWGYLKAKVYQTYHNIYSTLGRESAERLLPFVVFTLLGLLLILWQLEHRYVLQGAQIEGRAGRV